MYTEISERCSSFMSMRKCIAVDLIMEDYLQFVTNILSLNFGIEIKQLTNFNHLTDINL